jgi:hypothetical protein
MSTDTTGTADTTTGNDRWLTRTQLGERLQLPVGTLADWASGGTGPRYTRFGKHVRYRLADVIDWENGCEVGPVIRATSA